MKHCACGRLPDDSGWPSSMEPGLAVDRFDGTHRHSHCEITQTVSEFRPDQDTLLQQVERIRRALQWFPKDTADTHVPTKAWNDAMDQVYTAFLGLPTDRTAPTHYIASERKDPSHDD